MARYRVDDDDESKVLIEVVEVGENQDQLIAALGDCQAGHCSCPTNGYDKLVSMEIEQGKDLIRLRLQLRPGERLDTSQVAACLDYTTATGSPSREASRPKGSSRPGGNRSFDPSPGPGFEVD
jgi:hypothetical protein